MLGWAGSPRPTPSLFPLTALQWCVVKRSGTEQPYRTAVTLGSIPAAVVEMGGPGRDSWSQDGSDGVKDLGP